MTSTAFAVRMLIVVLMVLLPRLVVAQTRPPQNRFPPQGWPMPVEDNQRRTLLLGDLIDVTPQDDGGIRWDFNGWHGGDLNRIWFKSEGQQSFARADRNIDIQVLYGRFVKRYYDLQIGGGAQTATFEGRTVTRGQAVLGLEAFVPFKADLENLLFISTDGDVSARVTFERNLLITQRLLVQPRLESNLAIQRVEAFGVGAGLNDLELGVRLRDEIKRELAPYIGASWQRRLFETADLARAAGKNPGSTRLVFGVRAWQ